MVLRTMNAGRSTVAKSGLACQTATVSSVTDACGPPTGGRIGVWSRGLKEPSGQFQLLQQLGGEVA